MAVYEYSAIARTGKRVKGTIDADSPVAARRKLRDQQLSPVNIEETFARDAAGTATGRSGSIARIRTREVALMTRQLAVLLQAGMPLVEALTAVLEQTPNARLRKTVYDVRDKVNTGVTLADAMGAHPRVFTDLYVNMVRSGETGGALEQVLLRLADILERQLRLTHKVRAALAYPMVMAVVGTGVVSFLMLVIIPKITDMFKMRDQTLPWITELLISITSFVKSYWIIMVVCVVVIALLWRVWVRRPEGRRRWDRLKLRLPLFGDLYIKIISGRFARTLGTMLESGLTMMTALDVVKSVVRNRVIEERMDDVKSSVRRGQDLAAPLKDTGLFPPMMINMIQLGQRSGELESMLLKVADTYDEEVGMTVDGLVSLLEPIMILIMAVFVGFLVIAVLLPIFKMSSGM